MTSKRMSVSLDIEDYEWCKRNCLSLSSLLHWAVAQKRGVAQ